MHPPARYTDGRVLLTITQACAICQISRRTLYNWLNAGKLQWTRTPGGHRRIFEDSLFPPPPIAIAPPTLTLQA